MAAPLKNKNAVKLKSKEVKLIVYKQYCDWIASGKSKKAFVLDHPSISITWKTIERYMHNDVDFDPIHTQIAKAKSYAYWENIGDEMAIKGIMKLQPAKYKVIMRNKFNWT